jgi:hypothetical protein
MSLFQKCFNSPSPSAAQLQFFIQSIFDYCVDVAKEASGLII